MQREIKPETGMAIFCANGLNVKPTKILEPEGISMGRKDDIMAVARAFMRSRIILTAAELDLFTKIQEGE